MSDTGEQMKTLYEDAFEDDEDKNYHPPRLKDRTSSLAVGCFTLHTDRDHRGRFRGHQSMSKTYRGWHYHVDHPAMTQNQVFEYLEKELMKLGANKTNPTQLAIGNVEAKPSRVSLWQLGDRQTVLWISSITGALHIEANKTEEFAKSILTKLVLRKILQENAANPTAQEDLIKASKDTRQRFRSKAGSAARTCERTSSNSSVVTRSASLKPSTKEQHSSEYYRLKRLAKDAIRSKREREKRV